MLLLGLNGSPNKKGNTKFLLERILNKAKSLGVETSMMDLGELFDSLNNSFCVACSNPCQALCYKGTKIEEAFELMKKADGFVFGSPVYFGTVSAQMKAFFDKSRKLRTEKAFYNKVAAGVTVAASKHGGQETTIKALHDIMLVHGMIIVGDGYIEDDCGHHGVCAQLSSEKDEVAINRAEILSKRLIEVCNATSSLRKFVK